MLSTLPTTELTDEIAVPALQAALLRLLSAPVSASFQDRLTSELREDGCYANAEVDVATLAELGDYDRYGVGLLLCGRRFRLVIESES
jgi:hypothetical protein